MTKRTTVRPTTTYGPTTQLQTTGREMTKAGSSGTTNDSSTGSTQQLK